MRTIGTFLLFTDMLEVLGNTWAVAGAFTITYDGSDRAYASWPEVYTYVTHVRATTGPYLIEYTELSVVSYATAVEEALRTKAIEYTRGDDSLPWGLALVKAVEKGSSAWDHKKEILQKRRSAAAPPAGGDTYYYQAAPPNTKGAGGLKGKGKGKTKTKAPVWPPQQEGRQRATEYKRTWHTSNWDEKNNVICKPFNDSRGCRLPCPQGRKHVCDVVLAAGRTCGGQHSRLQHNSAEHGAPKASKR